MAETLKVELRTNLGKHNTRRLRRAGSVPAILYGHQQDPVCLSLASEEVDAAIRHGGRLVNLAGAMSEQAFIRDLQWDTFGLHVLHVDFSRISEHEVVEVVVAIELRGEAPGVREGGVIKLFDPRGDLAGAGHRNPRQAVRQRQSPQARRFHHRGPVGSSPGGQDPRGSRGNRGRVRAAGGRSGRGCRASLCRASPK